MCSQQKSCCEKTLLWALKSEVQPIPAEGCDSHLLLGSCHLNSDSVVCFEETGSSGEEKCLAWLGLGSRREQPRPLALPKPSPQHPQLDLFQGTHVHPKFSTLAAQFGWAIWPRFCSFESFA